MGWQGRQAAVHHCQRGIQVQEGGIQAQQEGNQVQQEGNHLQEEEPLDSQVQVLGEGKQHFLAEEDSHLIIWQQYS